MKKGIHKKVLLVCLFVFTFSSLSFAKVPDQQKQDGTDFRPDKEGGSGVSDAPVPPTMPQRTIEELNLAISVNPDDASLFYARGTVKDNQGQTEEAIEDFSKAIALKPKNGFYFFTRYNSYFALGKYQLALQDITKAIAFKKSSPELDIYKELFSNRGWLHLQMGNYGKAFEDYEKAIKVDAQALLSYPFVFGIASDQFNEYLKFLTRMILLRPGDARLYSTRSDLYSDLKEYDKAIDDLSKAIELDPGNNYYYYFRGSLYLQKGLSQKAKSDFQKICNLQDVTENFKRTVERACGQIAEMEEDKAGGN